jgi:uncharacterized phage-like protein YoqJ
MHEDGSVILVTGYKAHELGVFSSDHPGIPVISYALKEKIREYAEDGATWFVVSGQTGVELWAGQVCLELRDNDKMSIKLAVLMPFLNQEEHYKDWQKELYVHVLEQADYTGFISNHPYENPSQLRQKNDFLVAKTDAMLIVYDEESPGSPNFYLGAARRKANKSDYPIQTIDRYDLELASEELQQQNPDYWTGGDA